MTERDALVTSAPATAVPRWPGGRERWDAWALGVFAVALLVVLGWRFLADPTLSAPTRDPAWYTWRAQVILDADPGDVAAPWGPDDLFSGGYRVAVPLAGALLQRVADVDRYTFSALLMLGVPILTGLALGVALFRSRGDRLVVCTTLLASAALFLTTPYVGYLDNIMVLLLLSLTIPFLHEARTSWGARTALFLIGVVAAFTHPTTCVVYGVCLLAVFGWHLLTSRFRLGSALRADAPMLLATGTGMIVGLACWVVGIWGVPASLQEAALPPPYTAAFFAQRLAEWVGSLRPAVVVPLSLVAVGSTIVRARRTRTPARTEELASIWWMLAFAGALTVLTGAAIPYYRFMNASAAPMALAGLGAAVAVRWGLRGKGLRLVAGALVGLVAIGSLGWLLWDGLQHRWVSEQNQWANQSVRTSLAAVRTVVDASGDDRAIVLLANFRDTDDETGTNTGYGWAKTYTNVFRTGLGGDQVRRQVTYFGSVESFRALEPTDGASEGYDETSLRHFCELVGSRAEAACLENPGDPPIVGRLETYPDDPVVFLIGQYYGGLCNGGACGEDDPTTPVDERSEAERARFEALVAETIQIGPDTYVLRGEGLWTPPPPVVEAARNAAEAARVAFEQHPGALADLGHTARVLLGLVVLAIVPGAIAAPWIGARGRIDRLALVPGLSIVLTLFAGIAVLSIWRGPLTVAKGWTVVAVAVGVAAALRVGDRWLRPPLERVARFVDGLFGAFSNTDFTLLVGVQFLVQAGQGVIQGAIGKSIAFGGQQGFDVQNVPSADYLLKVVLALYIPYTLASPFVGVFIDRFPRRRVVWWANVLTAVLVTAVALFVLAPLGERTSEGDVGATVALVAGLLAAQGVVRVVLAVKSAAMPTVLAGRDLLQGNGLSQAGGALAQVAGIAVALGVGTVAPSFAIVVIGALVLVVAALVSRRMRHVEARRHDATFWEEASRVVADVIAGLREVGARPPAALGLSAFQMLRYQFWGFGLFVFGLYAKNLVEGGRADTLALVLTGLGGIVGGGIGLVLAQALKDRVPPIRLLLGSMALLGAGTVVFGGLVSVAGFAAMLFTGFFAFFLGKISADTIMQQAMPDDFRGRAFALFDIAYNLGYIVPAFLLSWLWVEGSEVRTRAILVGSGALFLALTAAVAWWAWRIRDRFAPQDDLVELPEVVGDPT